MTMRWLDAPRALAAAASLFLLAGCSSGGDDAPPPMGSFVYVANNDANTLTIFRVQDNGYLVLVGTQDAGSGPTGLAASPDSHTLYVANSDSPGGSWGGNGSVSVYGVDGASGQLVEAAGSPFAANTMALDLAVTPDGRFLYATNQYDFQVTALSVGAGGALAELASSPFDVYEAHSIAMHPSGSFLYVGNEGGGVHALDLDPATGELAAISGSPFAAPGAANWLSITPNGQYLYTADANNGAAGTIQGYAIDATTGALTALAPVSLGITTGVKSHAVTPDGKYLILALWDANKVAAYAIAADGSLTAAPGSPFAGGTRPKSVTIDSTGRFAYVANYASDDLTAYSIDAATGALTRLATYPVGDGPKMALAVP